MAKNIELLNSYSTANKGAVVQKIESAAYEKGGYITVFYGQDGNLEDKDKPEFTARLKAEVLKKFPDAQIMGALSPNGKRAIVCYTQEPLQEVVNQYQERSGEKFKRDQREIPFNERYELTKWRGHLGNIGQFFILLSGLGMNKHVSNLLGEKVKGKDKFSSPEKVISTIASVAGNALNSIFGVQKKPDDVRTQIVKRKASAFIYKHSPEPVELPSNKERLTPYTWQEKPETTDEKTKVFFQENAGIMSEVLKIVGKYSYFKGGEKKENDGDRVHGLVSMAAKFVTVLGKDEDEFGLDNANDWFSRLRQKSNLISGGMEWLANISQFVGAIASKASSKLTFSSVYKTDDDGNYLKDGENFVPKWNDEQQKRFAETFDKKNNVNTLQDLMTEGYIKHFIPERDPLTGKTADPYFVYTDKMINDYRQAGKAGTAVSGATFHGKDGATLKLHGKPSPGWQMVDFNNSFLNNWKKWDWLQLIGATFFTLSLSTKMMAPFTEKKINTNELFAHNAVGIAVMPEHMRGEKLAGLASHLIEMKAPNGKDMLPEVQKLGLAGTIAGIANSLYQRHEYDVMQSVAPKAVVAAASAPVLNNVSQALATEAAQNSEKSGGEMLAKPEDRLVETAADAKAGGALVADMRDRLAEARLRGEGKFTEKFGETAGMTLSASSAS